MENIQLSLQIRAGKGKGYASRLRREGKVPGVFYGPGTTTSPVCVDAREFRLKLAGLEGSHLIQILSPLPALNDKVALLKEIQRHPVSRELLHVDFYEVDVNKPLQATVSLHFIGKPQGVIAGGLLQPLRREITVECLPRNIPEFIAVDVSSLGIHDSIHIEELTLPEGVKAVYDTNVAVVTVAAPIVEAKPEEVVEEAAAPVEGAAPAEGATPAGGEKK
ncbi:MAG TPA: 50S ribosomal protein L25 [Candidatus Binatia bacterium]|nr:50S ribosomal protein L25 [Candidatus Binatia bacterium]